MNDLMEKVVSLCKRRGLCFRDRRFMAGCLIPGISDLAGAELKNIKDLWWQKFVEAVMMFWDWTRPSL